MKYLGLLVLVAFVGIVSSDLVCMQFKFSECFASLALRYFENPICRAHTELTQCLRTGAQNCDVESSPVVKDVLEIYTNTCTEGTEMNRMFKKHSRCVFVNAAFGNIPCLQPVTRAVLSLGTRSRTRDFQVKVLKASCRFGSSSNQFIDENILRTCGADGSKFRTQVSNPSVELSNHACREAEAEGSDIQLVVTHYEDDLSTTLESPHNHLHVAATAAHAANMHLATEYPPPRSGGLAITVVKASQNLLYACAVIFLYKWFSSL